MRALRVYLDTSIFGGLFDAGFEDDTRKHIVQPNKSVLFNMVNAAYGYSQLFIASPREILGHEKKER